MKDLWTGRAPLGTALLYVFVLGSLLWVIVGLIGAELVGRVDSNAPFLALLLMRAAIVTVATIIVYRCSRTASPNVKRSVRAIMMLVVALTAVMLAMVLPNYLMY